MIDEILARLDRPGLAAGHPSQAGVRLGPEHVPDGLSISARTPGPRRQSASPFAM